MKTKCPVCGIEGVIQQRGKSVRIQHYRGFINGKRVYEYHRTNGSNLEVNTKFLEVNQNQLHTTAQEKDATLGLKLEIMARDVGFEPTWPFDHRLSRPAPYQAWGIPHANYCQTIQGY